MEFTYYEVKWLEDKCEEIIAESLATLHDGAPGDRPKALRNKSIAQRILEEIINIKI